MLSAGGWSDGQIAELEAAGVVAGPASAEKTARARRLGALLARLAERPMAAAPRRRTRRYGYWASAARMTSRKRGRSMATLTSALGSLPESRSRSMTVRPSVSSDTVSTSTR